MVRLDGKHGGGGMFLLFEQCVGLTQVTMVYTILATYCPFAEIWSCLDSRHGSGSEVNHLSVSALMIFARQWAWPSMMLSILSFVSAKPDVIDFC